LIAAIVVVSALLFALFLVAAVTGNRAQTRMTDEAERVRREAADRRKPGA